MLDAAAELDAREQAQTARERRAPRGRSRRPEPPAAALSTEAAEAGSCSAGSSRPELVAREQTLDKRAPSSTERAELESWRRDSRDWTRATRGSERRRDALEQDATAARSARARARRRGRERRA